MATFRVQPWLSRFCYPLWQIEKESARPGGIFLPDVPTVIYTVEGSPRRRASFAWRRERCQQIMSACGFTNWEFFWGQPAQPYWAHHCREHAELLRSHDPPFLMLEDDLEVRLWEANVFPPAGAEVCYLGGFRLGPRDGVENGRLAGLPLRWAYHYGYLPIDADWMRIAGMWGSHAILWLDLGCMREAADLLGRYRAPSDSVYGREQYRWNTVCQRIPTFWQNDGQHYRDTYDYDYAGCGKRRRVR